MMGSGYARSGRFQSSVERNPEHETTHKISLSRKIRVPAKSVLFTCCLLSNCFEWRGGGVTGGDVDKTMTSSPLVAPI